MVCDSIPGTILIGLTLLFGIPFTFLFYKSLCCSKKDNPDALNENHTNSTSSLRNIPAIVRLSMVSNALFILCCFGTFLAGVTHCAGASDSTVDLIESYFGTFPAFPVVFLVPYIYVLILRRVFENLDPKQERTALVLYASCVVLIVVWGVLFAIFGQGNEIAFVPAFLFMLMYLVLYGYLIRLFWKYNKNANTTRYLVSLVVGFVTSCVAWISISVFLVVAEDDETSGLDFDDAVLAIYAFCGLFCVGLLFEFPMSDFTYKNLCSCCALKCNKSDNAPERPKAVRQDTNAGSDHESA